MRRPIWIAAAFVVVLLLALLLAPAAFAGKPWLFYPNHTADFSGDLSNVTVTKPEEKWVQVDKTVIRSDMQYNNYPLYFSSVLSAQFQGLRMGYMNIQPLDAGSVHVFRFNFGPEADGYHYQLYGQGDLVMHKSGGGYVFDTFTSTGLFIIYRSERGCRMGVDCPSVWTSDGSSFSFAIKGTPLP